MTLPRIDPHTHSTCSDGTDTPTQLMEAARRAGLDVVGLTDHDTTAGWAEAEAAVEATGVALVRGSEVSCAWHGITVHMLSYLHDPTHPALTDLFREVHTAREERIVAMVARIARDFPLTLEQVVAKARPGAALGRPHIADALIELGCFRHRNEVFAAILTPSSPYYVRYRAPHAPDVVAAIREAGGVPVLAHPRPLNRQRRVVPAHEIGRWADLGLFGIEVDHPDHTEEWREATATIARRYGLAMTGASDYHGLGKTTRLGENLTDPGVLAALEAAGTLPVVRPSRARANVV